MWTYVLLLAFGVFVLSALVLAFQAGLDEENDGRW